MPNTDILWDTPATHITTPMLKHICVLMSNNSLWEQHGCRCNTVTLDEAKQMQLNIIYGVNECERNRVAKTRKKPYQHWPEVSDTVFGLFSISHSIKIIFNNELYLQFELYKLHCTRNCYIAPLKGSIYNSASFKS